MPGWLKPQAAQALGVKLAMAQATAGGSATGSGRASSGLAMVPSARVTLSPSNTAKPVSSGSGARISTLCRHSARSEMASRLQVALVDGPERAEEEEDGEPEVLPGQRHRDARPRRREPRHVGAHEDAHGVADDDERHEEGHLEQKLYRSERARAQPAAGGDGGREREGRARRRHADRVGHVHGVETADRVVVGEREDAVTSEAGHDGCGQRPQEDEPEDGQRRGAERGP